MFVFVLFADNAVQKLKVTVLLTFVACVVGRRTT